MLCCNSSQYNKLLEFNHCHKSNKTLFTIYAGIESLLEQIDRCKNNPEKSSMKKVSETIPSGFSISTILSFKEIENKHDIYRGEDCMKKFCESLK